MQHSRRESFSFSRVKIETKVTEEEKKEGKVVERKRHVMAARKRGASAPRWFHELAN